MIAITELGNTKVGVTVTIVALLWLMCKRAWRTAAYWLIEHDELLFESQPPMLVWQPERIQQQYEFESIHKRVLKKVLKRTGTP
ncbi:hypothetical protein [Pseudomonas sp. LB1P83]